MIMQPQPMMVLPQAQSMVVSQPTVSTMQWAPQMAAGGGGLPPLDRDNFHRLKAMFAQNDRDNSNTLDANEVGRLLTAMGQPVNQQIIWKFFQDYDTDRSGTLSWSEFCAAFHRTPVAAPAPAIAHPSVDGKFTDAQFPPTPDSILRSPNGPADHIDDVKAHTNNGNVQWVRASELCPNGKLFNNIQPNDIAQGTLGDCWLLAGMAGLAEFEGHILSLFEQKTVTPDGKYTLRIYDMNARQWNSVVIDDYIPCVNGKPCMAQPVGNEMWVLLLEKAAAKWFGSYTQINGAFALVPFMFLTDGGPCRNFSQTPGNINGYDVKQATLADAKNRNSVQLVPQGQMSSDQLWVELMRADDQNFIMACWTTKDPPGGAAGRGASGEAIASDGIVKGHAYSFISADEYQADGQLSRVVRIRNPWGNNPAAEWKGEMSDNWAGWRTRPELRAALNIGDAECDGMFWMPWESFKDRYSDVGISPQSMATPRSGKSESAANGHTPTGGDHGKKFRKTGARTRGATTGKKKKKGCC